MFTRLSIALLAAAAVAEAQPELPLTPERKGYVIVTDTVKADGKTDVSDALQALIDANPNRTLSQRNRRKASISSSPTTPS